MLTEAPPAPTVAVIGGGPGALFLCHALEMQREELSKEGRDVSSFPSVRCFERSEGPGGVWRSDRNHDEEGGASDRDSEEEKKEDPNICVQDAKRVKTGLHPGDVQADPSHQKTVNMYSGLWTNAPKELFEFFDYTFKDHFGNVRLPTHLPRKHVLDYFLARVTRNCPHFFEKYFSFRTTVVRVEQQEDESGKKTFRVCTRDETTGKEEVSCFDKCVWAAGVNGVPNVPKQTVQLLESGGFPGRMVHSTDTANFKQDVEGKRVLMVGGGLSAEDLALMAVKEGVSRVYITCRSESSEVLDTTRWPYDKVEVLGYTSIDKVSGSTISLKYVYYDVKKQKYRNDTDYPERKVLTNIDTIIFCTGYIESMGMLEEELQEKPFEVNKVTVPEDWTMNPNEVSLRILGDESAREIRPAKNEVLSFACDDERFGFTKLYNGVFWVDNPSMMYHMDYGHIPLLEIDISSWMIAKVLTNQVALPSSEEMENETIRINLEYMHDPSARKIMDWKYAEAISDATEEAMEESSDANDEDPFEELWEKSEANITTPMMFRIMGRVMNRFGYPVSFLEKDGETFSKYYDVMYANYVNDTRDLDQIQYDGEIRKPSNDSDDVVCDNDTGNTSVTRPGWRTFRDAPSVEKCVSYFTGIKAISLPKPWVEMSEDDPLW